MATPVFKRIFSFLILICSGFLFLTFSACNPGKTVTMVVDPDLADYIRNISNDPDNAALNTALEHAGKARMIKNEPFIPMFAAIYEKENPGSKLASLFSGTGDLSFTPDLSNAEVISRITGKAEVAMKLTVEIVTARLKKIADNSSVSFDKDKQLIMVSFKGEKLFNEVSMSLFTTGDLRFLETYSNAEAFPILQRINVAMAACLPASVEPVIEEKNVNEPESKSTSSDTGSLSGYVGKKRNPDAEAKEADAKMKAMMTKYPLFAMVSPNVQHEELVAGPVAGFVMAKDTAKLRKSLSSQAVKNVIPANTRIFFSHKPASESVFQLYLVKTVSTGLHVVDGRCITKAGISTDNLAKLPAVDMEMNTSGSIAWRQMTRSNIGKYIAVIFDGTVFTCPRVESEITSGKMQMMGCFSAEEAKVVVNVLGTGKLPLRLWIDKSDVSK